MSLWVHTTLFILPPMMKYYIAFLLVLIKVQLIFAVSAYPYYVHIQINGKTTLIKMCGDEHNKWAETSEGYSIVQDNNNIWWYAYADNDGLLKASSFEFLPDIEDSQSLTDFKQSIPLHLSPKNNINQINIKSIPKATGERKILVILMSYPDKKFSKTKKEFDDLFNKEGYFEDGAQGSVRDFYKSASYGKLLLTSDIYGPYETEKNMSYYGNNSISGSDTNPYELFLEAINNVAKEVDLKIYDGDGDGFIDNVHIIYAGYGEEAGAEASAIWAHESTFYTPYEIQNVKIDKYSCAPELRGNNGNGITRIGPHCHEIGHALGAMDYYDTDYKTGGSYEGTGSWDVMAHGSWNNQGITPADFNPYVKAYDFGWINPTPLPDGNIVIKPSNISPDGYYLLSSAGQNDFYLLENRNKDGWGKSLPGEGLLIYHIYSDLRNTGNKINAASPQKCYVVCASSSFSIPNDTPSSYGNINSSGCPFPGEMNKKSFNNGTTPSAFYWSGEECLINLNDIHLDTNGDIRLTNNSEGSDFQHRTPISLFREDFEGENKCTLIEQNGKWLIVENPQETSGFVDRPLAKEGRKSLQLSAKNSFFEDKYATIEFECNSKTSDDDEIILSGYYTSYGLTKKTANTLKVGYWTEDNEWVLHELKSSVNLTWNPFVFTIPPSTSMKFRIEGEASMGSILALDEIELTVMSATRICNKWKLNESNKHTIFIYSLNGQKRSALAPGINIIRMTDGSSKKLYITK